MRKLLPAGLGAVGVALAVTAVAQETTRLRELAEPRRSVTRAAPAEDAAALGLRAGDRPSRTGEPLAIADDPLAAISPPRRRARLRRTRPPTSALAGQTVRLPTVSPSTVRPVQPPLAGLPDVAPPLTPRRRKPLPDDPYASLGLRSGGMTYFPAIQQSLGYDSNPNRLNGAQAKGSIVSRTDAELRIQSDWPVHELSGTLRGGYSAFPNVSGADQPDGDGLVRLRLDASRDTQIEFGGAYRIETQRPGSPDLNASVRERPLVVAGGLSAGVTQSFNRLSLALRGTVDRAVYEDARLTSGAVLRQSDRDVTAYGVRLRAGYELTPGVIPFVEVLGDTRVRDEPVDTAGFRRDSDGIGARAGSTFEITRTLTGEASAGYQARTYVDRRLSDLRGPLVDAALIWSATPLTTARLRATTQIDETSIPDSSGILVQRATLEVQHDLRRNVSVTGALTLFQNDYRGILLKEEGYAASIRADYRLTRSVALRASFTHERLKSTTPGSDYTANVVLVGLRFQP